MFHDLDTTLENVLNDAAAPAELRNAGVSFETPDSLYKPQNPDSAINLFLYEVKENRKLRNPEPITEPSALGFTKRQPPLRVDCSYLVTTWKETGANRIQKEHQLLGQAFFWLSRFPSIPANFFFGSMVGQPFPPPTMVAQWDVAKNQGEFWNALGIPPRPYFNLIVTIAMDLAQEVEGALVTTVTSRYFTNDPASADELLIIGGTVRDKNGAPVTDAWVRLEPAGLTQITDDAGRFIFA